MLFNEFPSFGQALSGASLSVSGTGTINMLVSDIAVINSGSMGFLAVTGTADILGNMLYLGSWATDNTQPGVAISYTDGIGGANSSLTQILTRAQAVWNWQRLGSAVNVMQLDGANRLVLTGTNSSQQLVLDPNGVVSVNGDNLLSQAVADSLYLSSTSGIVIANGNIGIGVISPLAKIQVDIENASAVGQIIKAAPSQTADLQQWKDGLGNVFAKVIAGGGMQFLSGTITTGRINNNGSFQFTNGTPGAFMLGGDVNTFTLTPNVRKLARIVAPGYAIPGRAVTIFGYDNINGYADVWFGGVSNGSAYGASTLHFATSNADENVNWANIVERLRVDNQGQVLINGFNNSSVGLTVTGGTSQTGNLQQWRNSAGVVLANITAQGRVGIGTYAPQAALDVDGGAKITGTLAITGPTNISGMTKFSGGIVVTGTYDAASNSIVSTGTSQLVLIPRQGDLSMGSFTGGMTPQ